MPHTWAPQHYFYVHRCRSSTTATEIKDRPPTSGLTVRGWDQIQVLSDAFNLAVDRFPCHDDEFVCIIEVQDLVQKRHVLTLEAIWECEYEDFEALMTAGEAT